jgi:biotin carboxyl carrier protein
MNVDVAVNGRPWKVAIEPADGPGKLTVTIKGKTRVVDASWVDADTLSLLDAGAVREIRFHARGDNGAVGVEIGGRLHEAIVHTKGATGAKSAVGATGPSAGAQDPKADAGGATGTIVAVPVKSPMPGRIVRVLVGVGDRVTARQPVVVVEAMKMENELRSPRDGVVTEVLVAPGAAVDSNAVLIVVGP